MNIRHVIAAVSALTFGLAASAASAGTIPYPNSGTVNPAVYNFTATSTGAITGYFDGSNAAYDETLSLLINGVSTGLTGLGDHSSSVGDSFVLGNANAGDTLTFIDNVSTISTNWSSNPLQNVDGANHIYATDISGQPIYGIPAGVFAAFEDEPLAYADLDYNDTTFVLTNVSVSPVPLPPALPMFGAALLGLAVFGKKKFRRSDAV